ncbi:ribosome maturation factor RimP [Actinotalea sp.]|uniref:ribosome maturation factor RimP n=1 Tax=Actinotalea sp. TaxID=1872145 RepID=UPI002C9F5FDD|nr:ribosome maturation factor RimP [Actinotalea sp.]HQY33035.1 ribosome maturation factor RimP [Actinotalea sp.]HRA50670.1 ribosome maturation factor RimP [Actinotalea sp.]
MVTPANHDPAERVSAVVRPVVEAAGLFLEDVHVTAAGKRSVVRIVLDLGEDEIGSLNLDTVGAVARDVSAAMDAADPVRGAYVLEVSSPGTDRPLTTLRHFRRARTRMVRLTLRDGSVLFGRLVHADADGLELELAPGSTRRVDLADAVRGVVEVELHRAHEVELYEGDDDADDGEDDDADDAPDEHMDDDAPDDGATDDEEGNA